MKKGDKVRCRVNDPYHVGDKQFSRRILTVGDFAYNNKKLVWVSWKEQYDGRMERFGNWMNVDMLVSR